MTIWPMALKLFFFSGCAYQKIIFLISQPKRVVGAQKDRLNETVLLSTQNICLNWLERKYSQFYAKNVFI